MAIADDKYYHDEGEGFENYIARTTDPGIGLFVFVIIYSLVCVCSIPFIVANVRKYYSFQDRNIHGSSNDHEESSHNNMVAEDNIPPNEEEIMGEKRGKGRTEGEFDEELKLSPTQSEEKHTLELFPRYHMCEKNPRQDANAQKFSKVFQSNQNELDELDDLSLDESEDSKNGLSIDSHISQAKCTSFMHIILNHSKCRAVRKIYKSKPLAIALHTDENEDRKGHFFDMESILLDEVKCSVEEVKSIYNGIRGEVSKDSKSKYKNDSIPPNFKKKKQLATKTSENPQSVEDPTEENVIEKLQKKKKKDFCENTFSIIRYDRETNRILILGIPFMVSAVAVALFDAVTLALVSKYLGVEALSAFVVTNVLLGLTDTFIKGVADALNTVCSHAIGADNYFLAGQYTQIALMIYVIGSLPLCVCWWFLMDDAIRLFGMNERVVEIGAKYTKVVMFDYVVGGMFDTFTALLDVSGYALPATIMDIVAAILDLLSVWLLLMFVDGMNLFWVGMAQMVSSVVIYAVFVCFVVCKGWIDPFKSGLVHSFGLKNTPAVKYVLKTAIPLSIGTLLEYGEWEALTFFAAVLGPAEVATWGILEAIWDIFEAFTEGLGEAGSIRLAFHLGKGNIEMAKISAWKSLFISTCLALAVSVLLFVLMPYIPGMFTDDETLQDMVHDVLPLIGIGNILMVFGMVSWSLIGAQGRFKLATMVSALMTFAVTLPLSAVSSIVYNFTLEGLVGAVVVGYSTTGLVLGCILQLSPWERISKKIQDLNAAENEDEESGDDSSLDSLNLSDES